MELSRLPYDPQALAGFYEEALPALGAIADRAWHDRLDVLAEGQAASLWNTPDTLVETHLQFLPTASTAVRDATHDVFPGCPLTFRLAEILLPQPAPFERSVLQSDPTLTRLPAPETLERLWLQQFPDTHRFRITGTPRGAHHFSVVALLRCEIQAIDQAWSLHRLAIGWPNGASDPTLAASFPFAQADPNPPASLAWPQPDLPLLALSLRQALELDLTSTLERLRLRQQRHLQRELERIDAYFSSYESELTQRRTRGPEAGARREQRLAAARAERIRRRADQIQRHTIHLVPHPDAFLLVAEPAWHFDLVLDRGRETQTTSAQFIPRSRTWIPRPATA